MPLSERVSLKAASLVPLTQPLLLTNPTTCALVMPAAYNNMPAPALKSASDALKKYEQFAGESRSKDVQGLHKEIDQLTKSLEKKHTDQDVAKAKEKVSGWWDRVTKWFKK